MPILEIDGESVEYRVRASKRAKRIFVKFSLKNGLEVVYPRGEQDPPPEELLRAQSRWVIANIRRVRHSGAQVFRRRYEDGELFLVRGKPARLKLCSAGDVNAGSALLRNGSLELRLPIGAPNAERESRRDAVIRYYRQLARDYLPDRLAEIAAEHGFVYNALRIKHQKTRWGSCSAKGNINLNLRLMMAPNEAIDYVIVHELCHLRELNHSRKFWRLVEFYCPEFRKWKAWLKKNEAQLVL